MSVCRVFFAVTILSVYCEASWWEKNRVKNEWDESEKPIEAPKGPQAYTPPASSLTRPVGPSRPARRLASVSRRVSFSRLGLLGGIGSASLKSQTTEGQGSLLNAGVMGELGMGNFGGEVDGFLGMSSGSADSRFVGGLFNLNLRYPMRGAGLIWIPKVGIGYGLMSLTQAEAGKVVTSSMTGGFWVAGIEMQVLPWLSFSGDFAMSLFASGGLNVTEAGNTTLSELPGDSKFQRIRASVIAQVSNGFFVGAQYAGRSSQWGFASPVNDSYSQIMGLIGYQW